MSIITLSVMALASFSSVTQIGLSLSVSSLKVHKAGTAIVTIDICATTVNGIIVGRGRPGVMANYALCRVYWENSF
jgi:hypothetical protein